MRKSGPASARRGRSKVTAWRPNGQPVLDLDLGRACQYGYRRAVLDSGQIARWRTGLALHTHQHRRDTT